MICSFGIFMMYIVRYTNIIGSVLLTKLSIPVDLYKNRSISDKIVRGIQNISSFQQNNHIFVIDETVKYSSHLSRFAGNLLPGILKSRTHGFAFITNQVANTNQNSFRETHFMTISGNGRLGNNMFQFAALLSCAKRLNYTVFLRSDHRINKFFSIAWASRMRLTNLKIFGEKSYGNYDGDIVNLDTSNNWSLGGYYQSWKYFYKDEDLIRSSFNFKPNIYETASQFVGSYRQGNKTIVGIHVRRGDLATQSAGSFGYSVAPISFIKRSMKYFRERYPSTLFIVVSDGINWCQAKLKDDNDTIFISFMNPGIDMAVLTLCDHVIVTSGTFGWWGAWLAGGDVVYFKGFPKPGSQLDKRMSREDYYPPHWIGLE
ncbi:hypothetical protein CHS0354_040523 [Potamilus streckersoni]|uniref:L-Fucosyltransferase n=1 Tax=Potamilus streckersoni TaxID=2493646 RepID=A0AAE0WF78_9BIVA|nr:hypothetical protein CHS0354_040523 [Potamilus streckersoni]